MLKCCIKPNCPSILDCLRHNDYLTHFWFYLAVFFAIIDCIYFKKNFHVVAVAAVSMKY